MQKRLSDSVKVRFLDKEKVLSALKELSTSLIKREPKIKGIFLFGSLVKDTYLPRSDADILIILKEDDRPIGKRICDYIKEFLKAPLPVEVFAYTERELKMMVNRKNQFIINILNEKDKLIKLC